MLRWVLTVCGVVLAAGLGLLVGYARWGRQAAQVERVEQRVQTLATESTALQAQKQELEQRLQEVNKEQERLARENEFLRKQHTTEQLVTGQAGELPANPPK